MTLRRLALLPRDGLFLKDGRGWYTSDIGRSHGHDWPLPPTIRGALRAAWGRALIQQTGRALDPKAWDAATAALALRRVLALQRPLAAPFASEHRRWPAPADALYVGDRVIRLEPRRPRLGSLGATDDPAVEALWRPHLATGEAPRKPERAPRFWPERDLVRWLACEPIAKHGAPEHRALAPVRRSNLHVTLDPSTQAAAESMLFSSEVVEPLLRDDRGQVHEWAVGVEIELPDDAPSLDGALTLGGRRRLAHTERLPEDLFEAPEALPERAPGLRLLVATPAHFERGWLPDGFDPTPRPEDGPYHGRLPGLDAPVLLRAALVPRPLDLSTWDMAQGAPRPTKRLVPAGAVYFFQRADGRAFGAADLRALWLAAWGGDTRDGLGLVMPGRWDPEPEERA